MPPSLPLLNVLSAPKSLASPDLNKSAGVAVSPHAGVDGGGSTFKQSLQKITLNGSEALPQARVLASTPEQDILSDSPLFGEEALIPEAPMAFVHLLSMRQAPSGQALMGANPAGLDGQGLSYLARLAGDKIEPQVGFSPSALVTVSATAEALEKADSLPLLAAPLGDELQGSLGVGDAQVKLSNSESGRAFPMIVDGHFAGAVPPKPLTTDRLAEGLANGKSLPQGLGASADAPIASPTTSATATLDASTVAMTLAEAPSKQGGKPDFNLILADAALASKGIAAGSDEAKAIIGKDGDAVTQGAVASSSMGVPANPLQLEGRTTIPMAITFGHAQWSNNLAERAVWMAGQTIHSAEIQLDPPELGPLQIKIQMNQEQATVSFVSANPQVREAVEQSMGRLRELFQEQGLELVDSGVSDQHPKQQRGEGEPGELGDSFAGEGGDAPVAADLQTLVTPIPWGVDYYV